MENYYKLYLASNDVKTLTPEEEIKYGHAIQKRNAIKVLLSKEKRQATDEELRLIQEGDASHERMVICNIRFGIKFANRYAARQSKSDLELNDYIQEAICGIMTAANKYDPDHNVKFSTYAAYWIEQSIRRAIEDKGETIRKPASAHSRARAVHKAVAALGDDATIENISQVTGISEEEVAFVLSVDKQQVLSLDNSGNGDDSEEEYSFYDTIPSGVSVLDEVNKNEIYELVELLINGVVSPDDRKILRMILGHNDTHAQMSYGQVAKFFKTIGKPKITEKYIRTLEEKTIVEWKRNKLLSGYAQDFCES